MSKPMSITVLTLLLCLLSPPLVSGSPITSLDNASLTPWEASLLQDGLPKASSTLTSEATVSSTLTSEATVPSTITSEATVSSTITSEAKPNHHKHHKHQSSETSISSQSNSTASATLVQVDQTVATSSETSSPQTTASTSNLTMSTASMTDKSSLMSSSTSESTVSSSSSSAVIAPFARPTESSKSTNSKTSAAAMPSGVANNGTTPKDGLISSNGTTLNDPMTPSNGTTLDDPMASSNWTAPFGGFGNATMPSNGTSPYDGFLTDSPLSPLAPPYNLNNVTCASLALMNGTQQWAAVDGNTVVMTFNDTYENNKLVCSDCFGMDKSECKSKDPGCQSGLKDLATPKGTNESRFDTAVAHFARDPDITDLQCELGPNQCLAAPSCLSCDGPGAFVMLKSLETMYNTLNTLYSALAEARARCTNQMQLFQEVFAPVPNIKNMAIILGVILGVMMGCMGLVPGLDAVGMAVLNSAIMVGSSVAMDEFFFSQPAPPDTSSLLGIIFNNTQEAYSNVIDSLFARGFYVLSTPDGKSATSVSMMGLMHSGALMQMPGNSSQFFTDLVPSYEQVLYQQIAVYTWSNLEADHVDHIPFIVFDNRTCDKINEHDSDEGSISSVISGIRKSDTNVTFNGGCYYLLDGKPIGSPVIDSPPLLPHCRGNKPLPGGTNKAMKRNDQEFAGLNLAHFVVPSVKGWLRNGKQNDYPQASSNGQLTSSPLDTAAVAIPVCDYIGNPKMPGVNCPKLNIRCPRKHCDIYDPSLGTNNPGDFNPGSCAVHVEQWQMNESENVNPLPNYQLSVVIKDAHGIPIGQATKQSAATTLNVVDGVLPYNLFVASGKNDSSTVQFWYAEQYWNSSEVVTHKCKVNDYHDGSRTMDCQFECDEPLYEPLPSATIAHPFPNAPTAALGGDKTFVNTFQTTATAVSNATATAGSNATASAATAPSATPTYTTGRCSMHIYQYQRNEENSNPGPNYQIEVIVYASVDPQTKKAAILSTSGKVPAPKGQAVPVTGLATGMTVTAQDDDSKPLIINFAGKTFDTGMRQCHQDRYRNGGRGIKCDFDC